MRGSDRSMRRDIDDIALSNHLSSSRQFTVPGAQQPLTGYGRKDMDDMVSYLVHHVISKFVSKNSCNNLDMIMIMIINFFRF